MPFIRNGNPVANSKLEKKTSRHSTSTGWGWEKKPFHSKLNPRDELEKRVITAQHKRRVGGKKRRLIRKIETLRRTRKKGHHGTAQAQGGEKKNAV